MCAMSFSFSGMWVDVQIPVLLLSDSGELKYHHNINTLNTILNIIYITGYRKLTQNFSCYSQFSLDISKTSVTSDLLYLAAITKFYLRILSSKTGNFVCCVKLRILETFLQNQITNNSEMIRYKNSVFKLTSSIYAPQARKLCFPWSREDCIDCICLKK